MSDSKETHSQIQTARKYLCMETVTCSVRTNTLHPVLSGFVPRVAGTLVASDHVDTLAVPAEPVTQLTLIDICERTRQSCHSVCKEQWIRSGQQWLDGLKGVLHSPQSLTLQRHTEHH